MNDPLLARLLAEADAHAQAGRLSQAETLFRQALAMQPANAHAHVRLGELALCAARDTDAETHFRAALSADPSMVAAANNLAALLRKGGHPDQSRDLLVAAIGRAPQVPELHNNLGNAFLELRDYEAAIHAYEAALKLRPRYAKALEFLAYAHRLTLRPDRSLECLRRAKEVAPTPQGQSLLAYYSIFSPDCCGEQAAALAMEWDTRYGAPSRQATVFPGTRDPERPLKIGYVSPNFANHSIGLMLTPLFNGHDREHFHVHCYGDITKSDDATERDRAFVPVFRDTLGLSDDQLAAVIRQDGIDVLIDLNLHMPHARLGVFVRGAAPVQITHLAYPFTSGLKEMDYRVTDSILDPPDGSSFGPEALLRLQTTFWLYPPSPLAPEPVTPTPARDEGYVTFTCLNSTLKLNPVVAGAWARILNRVPNSRLLLVADHLPAQQPYLERLFADAGLDPRRLSPVATGQYVKYLDHYRQADLCLDPFPYGGHTTTLDALWMGVPVLTLAGQAPYMRGAASILPRVGLEELVTTRLDDYEALAVALASDLPRLEALRNDLRGRMRESVLCDGAGFVADYERGLRLAWQRYCQGLPPADIDLG